MGKCSVCGRERILVNNKNMCVKCVQNEKSKEYKKAHKEEIKAYNKKYRKEHNEEIKDYNKKYHQEHREEILKKEKRLP